MFTWGANYEDQLGYYGNDEYRDVPTKVKSLEGLNIVKVACGYEHTAALTDKGKLLSW